MKSLEDYRKLLIVVDMVNGFIKSGNMADPYINHITPKLITMIEKFILDDEGIFFIKDTHEIGCKEFEKFPVHCLKGTYEANLIDELKGYEKYGRSYEKNSTSAIFAPYFMEDLRRMKNLNEVFITGCCSDICDINLAIPLINYFDENNMDVIVHVPSNLIETYNSENHSRSEYNEIALKLMNQSGIKTSEI